MSIKPFALLGVNSDADRDEIRRIVKEKNLTWRSWWDGSTRGPISTQWNIRSWPAIYLIDHEGVIRHKNLRGDLLDEALGARRPDRRGGRGRQDALTERARVVRQPRRAARAGSGPQGTRASPARLTG